MLQEPAHPVIVELPDFTIYEFKSQNFCISKIRQFVNGKNPFHLMQPIPVDDVCRQLLYL